MGYALTLKRLGVVAKKGNLTGLVNVTDGVVTDGNGRVDKILTKTVDNLYVMLHNVSNVAVPANSLTQKFALIIGGIVYPVTFGSIGRSWTIFPGGGVLSDPIMFGTPVAAGTVITEQFHLNVTAGQVWSTTGMQVQSANYSATDQTDTTVVSDGTQVAHSSAAILSDIGAAPLPPSVGLLGDSITSGATSWFSAGLTADIAEVLCTQPGETGMAFAAAPTHRGQFATLCKDIVDAYGANDANAGRTLAQFQADTLTTARYAVAAGCRTWVTTKTPITSSTDSWATPGNQTVGAPGTMIVAMAAWLRDGAPISAATGLAVAVGSSVGVLRSGQTGHPITGSPAQVTGVKGIIDTMATVESAPLSGKWKSPGYTPDGLHIYLAAPAFDAMASAVNPAWFA